MPHADGGPLQILLPILILVPVLYFRMRRMSKPQPLRLRYLWVRPALFLVLAGVALAAPQPGSHIVFSPADWAVLAVVAALGAVAGWYWGRMMAIEVHPENGTLMAKGGQAAMLVMVVLILLRLGIRYGAAVEAKAWHLNAVLIADASIVFAAMLFAVRGLEMFIRARRVMTARG